MFRVTLRSIANAHNARIAQGSRMIVQPGAEDLTRRMGAHAAQAMYSEQGGTTVATDGGYWSAGFFPTGYWTIFGGTAGAAVAGTVYPTFILSVHDPDDATARWVP